MAYLSRKCSYLLPLLLFASSLVLAADADIQQRLDRVERTLSSQGLLEMLRLIEQIQAELNQLRGELEQQSHSLEGVIDKQYNLYTDIDNRLRLLETPGNTVPSQPPPPVDPRPSTDGAGQAAVLTQEAATQQGAPSPIPPENAVTAPNLAQIQDAYQRAFSLLREARYIQAAQAFSEFTQAYPDSQYAGNAQYWLAETHYIMREYQQAISEYQRLLQAYPNNNKVPHAILKIAFGYHELGDLEEARNGLEHVMKTYPEQTVSRLAEERLQQIKQVSAASEP